MKIDLTYNEIKAIRIALLSKEIHHQKRTEEYNREGDKEMGKIHWEQSCYFSDLNQKIKEACKGLTPIK
jgi:hypothetical protein